MRTNPIIEYDSFITADGEEYPFHTLGGKNSRYEISDSGSGMPPIEWITQRGPYQHGESVRDFFLRPRIVQVVIRNNQCSRADLFVARAALLNILRPNRSQIVSGGAVVPGVLRKRYPDLKTRDLDCLIEAGPRWEPRSTRSWDEFSFTETLRFVAHNPIYYDPTIQPAVFTSTAQQLVFPVTFPIVFNTSVITGSLTYNGNWIEYPTITIDGPLSDFTIQNTTTNEKITVVYSIATGQQIVIDLTYGVKSITGPGGVNLVPYMGASSDLLTFHLANGVNSFSFFGTGFGATTKLTVTWKDRYIGV